MDSRRKLAVLAQAAQYDLACACGGSTPRSLGFDGKWIYPVALPNGGTLPVLKVLQSTGCERNCHYCVERSGGQGRRVGFAPDELASAFMNLVRADQVRGLFLSSAIRNGAVATMDRMLATLERIRFRHGFHGFIHAKIIPGAEEEQIVRAMQLANRVSVNLEAPSAERLGSIAPGKRFKDQLAGAMSIIAKNLGRPDIRCRSHTTQYVVGAAKEADREILQSLWDGYRGLKLGRGYFSAFQPVEGTPLESMAPTPAMREHRLYQVDFLFRKYGFELDELVFDDMQNLSLKVDPKTLWAERHPERFPVEINKAERSELLRVPGIGPDAASRIVEARLNSRISDLDSLKALSRGWRTAAPYLLFDGKRRAQPADQLAFPFA